MNSVLAALGPSGRLWFGNLCVAMIRADETVCMAEFNRLKSIASKLQEPSARRSLCKRLESSEEIDLHLQPPDSIPKVLLPFLFLELAEIALIDGLFDNRERQLLIKVGEAFNFSSAYYQKLLAWCEEGTQWRNSLGSLFPDLLKQENHRVPVHEMNPTQRIWYAEVLIGAVLSQNSLTERNSKIVKRVLVFIKNPDDRKRLYGFIINRLRPNLLSPPNLDLLVTYRVLVEVMDILTSEGELTNQQMAYFSGLVQVCNLSEFMANELINWCRNGVLWRKKAKVLAREVSFSSSSTEEGTNQTGWQISKDNNSLLVHRVTCFLCDSEEEFPKYRLRAKTQKSKTNIFGIPKYFGTLYSDADPVIFHHVAVSICPTCGFASNEESHFRKDEKDSSPFKVGALGFKDLWLEGAKKRKSHLNSETHTINYLQRDHSEVVASYKMAALSMQCIYKLCKDDSLMWRYIGIQLVLAQLLMDQGAAELADSHLFCAQDAAKAIMESSRDDLLLIRTSRMLVYVGLYKGDNQAVSRYMNFLMKCQERVETMEQATANTLKKIVVEINRAYQDRMDYLKRGLNGYMPK